MLLLLIIALHMPHRSLHLHLCMLVQLLSLMVVVLAWTLLLHRRKSGNA
jgi:hypothetical protein